MLAVAEQYRFRYCSARRRTREWSCADSLVVTPDEIAAAIVKELGHQEHVLRTMRLTGCTDAEVAVARARINGLRDALGIVDPEHPKCSKRKP